MTESGNNKSEPDVEPKSGPESKQEQLDTVDAVPFGERLFAARESQGLTIADIANDIHLSEDVIDAIERSDVDRLPQPTFVQGYLRTYARHLRIPEAPILDEYSKAVPHTLESELHPRSMLPDEADSGSPFVKSVSIVLVILMLMAAIYGVYSYYSEMVDAKKADLENDTEDGSMLVIPEYEVSMETPTVEPGSGGQVAPLEESEPIISGAEDRTQDVTAEAPAQMKAPVEVQAGEAAHQETVVSQEPRVETQPVAAGDDVVELVAHEDSWTEVVDANDVGLLYDLVQQEHTVVLRGTAPFDIFLGNAPAMEIRVNGIKIDMTKFVRSNKIAHFNVSTNDQQVVFH